MLQLFVRVQNWMARVREEEGQGMVEYGLIIALVAIGLIAVLGTMKGSLNGIFNKISSTLTSATS